MLSQLCLEDTALFGKETCPEFLFPHTQPTPSDPLSHPARRGKIILYFCKCPEHQEFLLLL